MKSTHHRHCIIQIHDHIMIKHKNIYLPGETNATTTGTTIFSDNAPSADADHLFQFCLTSLVCCLFTSDQRTMLR